jgi:hypothetical protein
MSTTHIVFKATHKSGNTKGSHGSTLFTSDSISYNSPPGGFPVFPFSQSVRRNAVGECHVIIFARDTGVFYDSHKQKRATDE